MASASREEIASGESWPTIDHIDQVLSLGCDDVDSAEVHYQTTNSSILESSFGWFFGDFAMEHYLLGISNLFRTIQGPGVNKGQGE
jgi:hypothetical protein